MTEIIRKCRIFCARRGFLEKSPCGTPKNRCSDNSESFAGGNSPLIKVNFTTGAFTVVSEIFRKLFCGAPETSCLSKFKDYIVTGRNKNWGSYCLCLVTEAQEGPLSIFLTVIIIIITWMFIKKWNSLNSSLREKCPNRKLFLVRIFLYSDESEYRKIRTRNYSVFGHIVHQCLSKRSFWKFLQHFYENITFESRRHRACNFTKIVLFSGGIPCKFWNIFRTGTFENTRESFYCQLKLRKQPPHACKFIKNKTLSQVFSWEFFEIFQNTFFTEHLLVLGKCPVMCC